MTKFLHGSLAFVLWLTTVALGLVEIGTVRNAVLTFYAWLISRNSLAPGELRSHYWSAVVVGQVLVIVLALVVVGVAIAAGEYHVKHLGERRSWRLFGWTLAVQLLVLLLTWPFS